MYNSIMLKIFDANTETAAAEAVFREFMNNNTEGSRHVVLTPDRYSLSVEKKIFEFTGLSGAMNVDVYSFTNFAKRAVKGLKKCLSKEGTVVLLREVLAREAENLEYYRNAARLKTFPKELFAVMASIRNSGISPERLSETFGRGNDASSKKYRDIARVYGAYQKELSLRYTDTTGRLDALIEAAPRLREVTESHFYVVGFFGFYRKQMEILEALIRNAKSVNIAAVTSVGGANDALYGTKLKNDAERLRKLTGTEFVYHRDEIPLAEPMGSLAKNIFAYREGRLPPSENVVLFKENTPYDELKAVAREIARLVRREGYRYKEIAVLTNDESYKPVVKDIFQRFGIPFFTDTKYELRTAASVRYFTEALNAVSENRKRSAVLRFVKNPLFPSERDKTDAFENYVLKYNVNFNRFTEPFLRGEEEERGAAEEVRLTLNSELPDFPDRMTANDAVARSKAFFSEDLLKREAELIDSVGDEAYRKLHEQAAELLLKQLDEMQEILGEKPVTLAEFRDAAISAILSVSVSLIPMTNDCVFVGTGEESALFDVKALFLAGCSEGNTPKAAGYQAIMPEKDVLLFEKRGIPLYPTPMDRMREEKAKLVNLILKAGERLYAGYPEYNLLSEPTAESELMKELRAVSGYETVKLSARFSADGMNEKESAEDFLVTEENALYEYRLWKGRGEAENSPYFNALGARLAKNGRHLLLPEESSETLSKGKRDLFFASADGAYTTSASQLECYATCPYKHFLLYGLKARERDVAETKASDVGSIVHRALEIYFKNTRKRLKQMSDGEIVRETERAIETAFREEKAEILKETKFGKILFRALKSELEELLPELTEAVRRSKFEPDYIEYRFDTKRGSAVGLEASFGTVYLTGKIDRADTYRDDLILIDYKTGSKTGSLTELYEGRKIQLALYAMPFRKKGYRVVGAYYLPLPDGYRTGGREVSLVGNTLNLPSVIAALDETYSDGAWSSRFFPFKNKVLKKGTSTDAKKDSALLSEEQFAFLENLAAGEAKNAAEELDEGFIAKRPVKDACKYCAFRPLCAKKSERKSKTVKWSGETLVRAEKREEDEE